MIKFIHANNISPNDIHWYFLNILQRPNSGCEHRQWLMHFSNDICWTSCSKWVLYSCQCIKWRPWQCVASSGDYIEKEWGFFSNWKLVLSSGVTVLSVHVIASVGGKQKTEALLLEHALNLWEKFLLGEGSPFPHSELFFSHFLSVFFSITIRTPSPQILAGMFFVFFPFIA